jgi:hypothetical protein
MKILCGIPGADKRPNEREEHDKNALRVLEHRRWNAYMRTEGYVYAETRNNLAKTHPCLVKFDELPLKEQEKDDDEEEVYDKIEAQKPVTSIVLAYKLLTPSVKVSNPL